MTIAHRPVHDSLQPCSTTLTIRSSLDLELSHDGLLLRSTLHSSVTQLGTGVDELEADLLQVSPRGVNLEGLTKNQRSLEGTGYTSLDHDEVLVDDTAERRVKHARSDTELGDTILAICYSLVGETTHGGDGLVTDIVLGGSRLGVGTGSDPVDLLVLLGTVVVTVLTGTRNRVHDVGWMPSSDTGDLSETSVGLPVNAQGEEAGSVQNARTVISLAWQRTWEAW
jgi:hypothetical protein